LGRNRKPFSTQLNEGDPRKHGRHKLIDAAERVPTGSRGLPKCPRHLKGRARSAWNFLKSELEAMDLDYRPDALALEGGCLAYQAAIEAEELLIREGFTVEEPIVRKGVVAGSARRSHPANRIRHAAWARFQSFCDRFGLSPKAREAISIQKKADNSDLDLMAILAQPRARKAAPNGGPQ
jgi:P27 family predicted phage terminase small subunit